MEFSFQAINLTDVIVVLASGFVSLIVAYFTSKREMKKRVFDGQVVVFRELFAYLRRLNKEYRYKYDFSSLKELSKIDADLKLFGSRSVLHSVARLKNALKSIQEQNIKKAKIAENQLDGEVSILMNDEGISREEAKRRINQREVEACETNQLGSAAEADADSKLIKSLTSEIIDRVRKSMGVREFRPKLWLQEKPIYRHITLWR